MLRMGFMLAAAGLAVSACSMTPTVTKAKMTLGEAHMEDMQCRRGASTGTNIPKTVCASEETWKRYDAAQRDRSEYIIDEARDNNDNRILYRNQ